MKRNGSVQRLVRLVAVLAVLALAPGAWAAGRYKTLSKFSYSGLLGNLVFDQAGNLYGTTEFGGGLGEGEVFKLTPNSDGSWTKTVAHSFCSLSNCDDGGFPTAGLISDANGNLYGTTQDYGIGGQGVVYELVPSNGKWTELVLYSFTGGHDGAQPSATPIFDSSGNLYGTTENGGVYNHGTVFKLTPHSNGTWTESILYHFTGGDDGAQPFGGVIVDATDHLYGLTQLGGENNFGVVFRLNPTIRGTWKISVLHAFTGGRDGGLPGYGGLIMDAAGSIYGTTRYGGLFEYGAVFKLTPSASRWKETLLHSFTNGRDGSSPYSNLTFDPAGNLYGTASQGGHLSGCGGNGCGVVFKLTPNANGGWKEILLWAFGDSPGASPVAGVVLDGAGNLYGTTNGDGVKTRGSVFEIMP